MLLETPLASLSMGPSFTFFSSHLQPRRLRSWVQFPCRSLAFLSPEVVPITQASSVVCTGGKEGVGLGATGDLRGGGYEVKASRRSNLAFPETSLFLSNSCPHKP